MVFTEYTDPAKRFLLRELEKDDIAGLVNLDRVLFFPYLRHVVRPGDFIEQAIAAQTNGPRTLYLIGIVSPADRRNLIGIVGAILTPAHAADAYSLDVGYALIPDFQKRGIATSALRAFLARTLTPEIIELTASVDPENLASIRLLEACGFRQSGLVEASKYPGDPDNPDHYEGGFLQLRPRLLYRVTPDEFR